MKSRLFYKFFLTYLVVVSIAIFIMSLFFSNRVKDVLTREIEGSLSISTRIMTLMPLEAIKDNVDKLSVKSGARLTLIDDTGKVVVDSELNPIDMDNHLNRPEVQEARVKGHGEAIRYSHTLGVDMMYMAEPIKEGEKIRGYVRLARPLFEVKKSLDELNRSVLYAIMICFVPAIIIAFVFSMKLIAPIRRMERFTQRVRDGESPGVLLVDTKDEVGRLAINLRHMVVELHEKIRVAGEERGKLIAAFASMSEGVMVIDNAGQIEAVNRSLSIIIDRKDDEIIGKTPLEVFRSAALKNALEQFRTSMEQVQTEITFGEEDKETVLDVTISPIKGSPDNVEKTLIVFHDVTRLKKLERIRVDFIANVTHEIKTPLTAILGFIETLQAGALEDKATARRFFEIIARHAERLNRLVDDLLTISDIELGDVKLNFEEVNPADAITAVLNIMYPKSKEKRIAVNTDLPDELPMIKADKDKLIQVLLNVVDNAIKFNHPEGVITISAHIQDSWLVVVVKDTGIGVPQNEIGRLGERFYRVDKTRSREMGGTGLGLSIVKHLMVSHGGRMEIESQMGKGTEVSLFFPLT